jgi:hypothetical protein
MSRFKCFLFLIAFYPVLLTAQTIFSDDFNRTTIGANWTVLHGNWSIENNRLKHVGDGTFDDNFLLYTNAITSSSYTIECKMMWQSNGFFEDGIIFFNKSLEIVSTNSHGKKGNYYIAYLSNYYGNEARLDRLQATATYLKGASVVYPNLDTSVTTNKWFNLKIQVLKNSPTNVSIKYFVFNKPVVWFYGDVDSILSDKVGLGGVKGEYGQTIYFDDFVIYGPSGPTNSVNGQSLSTPHDFNLSQNYPNPFNPSTTIEFSIPNRSSVQISVFNTTGQLVKNIQAGEMNQGVHSVVWDGKDDHGVSSSTGTYFYQVKVGETMQSKKMVLLK